MKYTVSEVFDILTGGEFYLVNYKDEIYVLSSYRLGDKNLDYGVYGVLDTNEVKHGDIECLDCIPDIFIDSALEDISELISGRKEVLDLLYENPASDWWIIFDHYGLSDDSEISVYYDISKLFSGDLKLQGENITTTPNEYERRCIDSYIKENW